ncbi:haloacid dehalogenase type II [Pseudohongiella nitratireducens]|uniref:haloacid dehalogenase type II n=1 Tax=Pseudohongiella nitratireducens TaxID=1768907 RepID=UPI0030EB2AC3|tara:strand:- start:10888 stop:11748 length:861 start_codon:yes stop_codon:yes gene_type:complete
MTHKTDEAWCNSGKSQSAISRRFFFTLLGGTAVLMTDGLISSRSIAAAGSAVPRVKALVFDVFGTVVDWRGSIIREGQLLAERKGYNVDWGEFADRWRAGYGPSMNRVRTGELPWTKLDDLHRIVLDELVEEFSLTNMSEEELQHLNYAWHRLTPWPDVIAGLSRLKNEYPIATLSNGNVSLLMNMAKNAGLPWDTIMSAELSRHYKPDPEAYLKAPELFSLAPDEVMLVAAHPSDLRAAAAAGLSTGYVHRALERGAENPKARPDTGQFDIYAEDFLDLARQLGA